MTETPESIPQYINDMRRFALGLTRSADAADDIVQDSLEKAVARFAQYRQGTDLKLWLLTIVRHQFIDQYRKAKRRGTNTEIDDHSAEMSLKPSQESTVMLSDVMAAIKNLSSKERKLVTSICFEGQSYHDVAEDHGMKVGTVKSRMSRIRSKLRAAA